VNPNGVVSALITLVFTAVISTVILGLYVMKTVKCLVLVFHVWILKVFGCNLVVVVVSATKTLNAVCVLGWIGVLGVCHVPVVLLVVNVVFTRSNGVNVT
jgi:hypothetical protein